MSGFGVREIVTKNRHSRASSDATALVFGDRRWSYEALEAEIDAAAAGLAHQGFTSDDRLAILAYNRPEYVVAFFAVAQLGGVVVPLNYYFGAREIAAAVEESGTTWLLVDDALTDSLALLPDDVEVVVLGDPPRAGWRPWAALVDGSAPAAEPFVVTHDREFLYQFSSGTTGTPKAAIHTHGNVLFNALTQVAEFTITRRDTHLVIPALCWGAGFHDYTLATWWQGGTVVLHPSRSLDVGDLRATIRDNEVTTVLLVPSVIRMLLRSEDVDDAALSSLRIILSGGEPVPVDAIRALQSRLPGTEVIQAYGLSEFPVITTFLDGEDAVERRGSAGKATLGAIVRVVDDDGHDVAPGEIGEIVSKSLAGMVGYTGEHDTSGTHVRDGWLHTGDRARIDEEGYLYIAGRKKDMIISGGLNVYPAEIERVLDLHPAVAESAVIGCADERYGEVGLAVVVSATAASDLVPELRARLRDEISHFKVPRHWVVTTEPLPRTTSRKVQKFLLREAHAHHLTHCRCDRVADARTLTPVDVRTESR